MPEKMLKTEEINTLINSLLKEKDPASVGLKRILKEKSEEGKSFPYKRLRLNDFGTGSSGEKIFDKNEREILQLEKKCRELELKLSNEKTEAEKAAKAAFDRGVEKGREEGLAEGKKEAGADYDAKLKEIQNRMAAFIEDVELSKNKIVKDSGRDLLELSFLIAEKVLGKQIDEDRDAVFSVIRKSLDYIAERGRVIVKVSPDDYENVSSREDFWNSIGEDLENITIRKDSRIEKGGCIIESGSASVDARIDVQFDEMKEVVESAWRSSEAEGGNAEEETGVPDSEGIRQDGEMEKGSAGFSRPDRVEEQKGGPGPDEEYGSDNPPKDADQNLEN